MRRTWEIIGRCPATNLSFRPVLLSSRSRGLALASRILEDTSWKSWPWPWHLRPYWPWEKSLGQDFPPQSRPRGCCIRVCSAHTHSATWQSAISCLGMFHRLACKKIQVVKIIRVCEVRAAVWCQYLSRWLHGLSLIVSIGLDQRTYCRSGRVSTGISDVWHGLTPKCPHHLVI